MVDIWNDLDLVKAAVVNSTSIVEALRHLGYKNGGLTRIKLLEAIKHHKISIDHFTPTKRSFVSIFDDKDMLEQALLQSNSLAEVMRKMGAIGSGASYKVINQRIKKLLS